MQRPEAHTTAPARASTAEQALQWFLFKGARVFCFGAMCLKVFFRARDNNHQVNSASMFQSSKRTQQQNCDPLQLLQHNAVVFPTDATCMAFTHFSNRHMQRGEEAGLEFLERKIPLAHRLWFQEFRHTGAAPLRTQ